MGSRAQRAEELRALAEAYRGTFLQQGSDDLLPQARIVIDDLRHQCCADRSTIERHPSGCVDPMATAHNEGRRFAFLRLMQCITTDPAKLHRMIDAAAYADASEFGVGVR